MNFNLTRTFLLILSIPVAAIGSQPAFADISYRNFPPSNGQPESVTSQFQIHITGKDAQKFYEELQGPELIHPRDQDCEMIVKFGESITCYHYPKQDYPSVYECVTMGELPSGNLVAPLRDRKSRMLPAQGCGSLVK